MPDAPLMLSVSGLRGVIGASLTPVVAARYAAAFGQWLKDSRRQAGGVPHVVLGRDSRPSGQMIEMAAVAGLVGVGCRVTTLGVVSTPSVAIMTEQLSGDGGMVITASHNPIIWNGIKALRADGVAPDRDQANQIIERFHADQVGHVPVEGLAPVAADTTTHEVHVARVLDHIDAQAVRRGKLKVVLDSVHGAGGVTGALLLERLGVELVHLYGEPTGQFPHEPEPMKENLTHLSQSVRQHGADIGFAQDPDADRLAVVDENGCYMGEEYTLALAAMHVLQRGDCPSGAKMVANLSTSRMIDDIALQHNASVVRTPVGEASVAAAIRSGGAVIGGEGNGGVIWPRVIHVRDSMSAMALLLEMAAQRGVALSRLVAEIPRYAIVKDKVNIDARMSSRYAALLQEAFASESIDLQDGVRIDWADRWVHVRPSNTEPILRMIAEAASEADAAQLIDHVRRVLGLS